MRRRRVEHSQPRCEANTPSSQDSSRGSTFFPCIAATRSSQSIDKPFTLSRTTSETRCAGSDHGPLACIAGNGQTSRNKRPRCRSSKRHQQDKNSLALGFRSHSPAHRQPNALPRAIADRSHRCHRARAHPSLRAADWGFRGGREVMLRRVSLPLHQRPRSSRLILGETRCCVTQPPPAEQLAGCRPGALSVSASPARMNAERFCVSVR